MSQGLTRRQTMGIGAGAALLLATAPWRVAAEALRGRGPAIAADQQVALELRPPDADGWRLSKPVEDPAGFNLAGVTWNDRGPLRVEARVRRAGEWAPWARFGELDGHLPDDAAAPSVTQPLWLAGAGAIQLRLSRAARDPRLHIVPAEASRIWPRARARIPGAPDFISRSEWGAQRPRHAPEYGAVRLAFVHHTVTTNDYAPKESSAIVRSIQRYHRNVLGWDDIGYNALIDRHGQIFEGRAGGLNRSVIGAQAQGFNAQSTGVALIGDYRSHAAPPAALRALATFLSWKLGVHDIGPTGTAHVVSAGGESCRYPKGRRVELPRITGHRAGDLTSCPGAALDSAIPRVRWRVGRREPHSRGGSHPSGGIRA